MTTMVSMIGNMFSWFNLLLESHGGICLKPWVLLDNPPLPTLFRFCCFYLDAESDFAVPMVANNVTPGRPSSDEEDSDEEDSDEEGKFSLDNFSYSRPYPISLIS